MAAMTDEQFEEIMKRVQTSNMEIMKAMMEELAPKKEGGGSLVDTRGIGKPPGFKGTEVK